MAERIFLTYTNATAVPYQGSVLGHHIVLNYVDSDGKHYTLQGMPEHGFDHNAGEYRPYSQNSNSFAAGALRRAGFWDQGPRFLKCSIV